MKETVFTQKHIALGAKMAPFAGFNMPIEYSGLIKEHTAVRENVGLFDVSHMGEIWVFGPNAKALLQYITTNDVDAFGQSFERRLHTAFICSGTLHQASVDRIDVPVGS